jgi:hypothetical protein
MVNRVSFESCDFNGVPFADSPEYRFVIDKHVYTRWGGDLPAEMCRHLGISEDYAHEGED